MTRYCWFQVFSSFLAIRCFYSKNLLVCVDFVNAHYFKILHLKDLLTIHFEVSAKIYVMSLGYADNPR